MQLFRLISAFCACLFVANCASDPGGPNPGGWRAIELDASPFRLHGDKTPEQSFAVGALVYRGGLRLQSDEASFGGYSGLTVSPDGEQFLALSDRSHWLTAAIAYGSAGRLVDAENALVAAVTAADAAPLTGDAADSEAVFADGPDLFVGFERQNRIDVYRSDEAGGIVFDRTVAAFDNQAIPYNQGVEAMAPLNDGRIIAFSEGALSPDGGVKAWIVDSDGALAELAYKPAEAFNPTDAMRLPGGDILVLERAYSPSLGSRARLARIPLEVILPGALLEGSELALFEPPLAVDNMEGLAVRKNAEGKTLIYLISDDNQNRRRQKTLLLMFELEAEID